VLSLVPMKTSNLEILSPMNLSSSSAPLILGTETSSSTSKPNAFIPTLSREEHRRCICHHSRRYLILGDTLYMHRGIDTILRRCVTHEEAKRVLNECHLGACGGHLSGMATAQKILRAGYFWPSIFKDCHRGCQEMPTLPSHLTRRHAHLPY
jgi:hypothetical protein